MELKTKEVQVFIAKDGKEFLTENECIDYEHKVLSILEKMKYFYLYHSPDLTEGRGFYGETYFAVYDTTGCQLHRVLEYIIKKYGSPIGYVMGVSPIINYSIPVEITKERYNSVELVNSYSKKITKVLISPEPIGGFSEPFWTK